MSDAVEQRTDIVTAAQVAALAATLDVPEPAGVLPPLWHWVLFQDWQRPGALAADGHPRSLGAPPGLRRMWAGGRVEWRAPLPIGEALTRRRHVASVQEKQGASGPLRFVTWRDELFDAEGVLAVVDEVDLVYRGRAAAAVRATERAESWLAGALVRELVPDPVLLFRYSALTGNSHRIHYDLDYATQEETYPGLVVHGPLQATLLAAHAVACAGGATLRRFGYRARRPAFAGRVLTLAAWRPDGVVQAQSHDDLGAVCMTAEAEFA